MLIVINMYRDTHF